MGRKAERGCVSFWADDTNWLTKLKSFILQVHEVSTRDSLQRNDGRSVSLLNPSCGSCARKQRPTCGKSR